MMNKLSEDDRNVIKELYVKAYLPCDEIANRMGVSRQAIHNALRSMEVNTSKRNIVTKCDECGDPVERRRAEFRKSDRHFCSSRCYGKWTRRPAIQQETFRLKLARDKCATVFHYQECAFAGFFLSKDDILMFPDRDALLEWKRTGHPAKAKSINRGEVVMVVYNKGRVNYVVQEEEADGAGSHGKNRRAHGDAGVRDGGVGEVSSRDDEDGDGNHGIGGGR